MTARPFNRPAAIEMSAQFRALIGSMLRNVPPERGARFEAPAAMARHGRPLSPAQRQWFLDAGVSLAAIDGTGPYGRTRFDGGATAPNPIVAAKIVMHGPDSFEFAGIEDDPGEIVERIVALAHDATGAPADVFAWNPKTGAIACFLSRAGVADERECVRPRMDEALAIHANPLDWLRAGRKGALILHERRAASILNQAGPLLASNIAHGRHLQRALAAPVIRVVVAQKTRAAA